MKSIYIPFLALVIMGCQNNLVEHEVVETINEEIDSEALAVAEFDDMAQDGEYEGELSEDFTWTLTPTSVGDFNLGDSVLPEGNYKNFEVQYTIFEQQEEEGPNMETIHRIIVSENGVKALEIDPSVYQNKPQYIQEIRVFSEKFKNHKMVSVGTTIEEFFDIYPDAEIWYSYVSDRMVMETPTMSIQFELDKNDYIPEIVIETDMDMKKKEDFKLGASIKSIRIY